MTAANAHRLRPGDEIAGFSRVADFDAWNRYAAVNDEFVPIHMDDAAGREAGHPSAIGMGNLGVSQIHCMLRAWLAGRGRIASVALQFRSPAVRGRTNTVHGTVEALDQRDDARVITLAVRIVDDEGTVLTRGIATLEVPLDDG